MSHEHGCAKFCIRVRPVPTWTLFAQVQASEADSADGARTASMAPPKSANPLKRAAKGLATALIAPFCCTGRQARASVRQ